MSALDNVQLHLVETLDDVCEFARWLGQERPILALDTETTSLEYWGDNQLRLVQFGDARTGWALPWDNWAGVVRDVLRRYTGPIVLQNAMFDAQWLSHNGAPLPWAQVHDTKVMLHLLNPLESTGLKSAAKRYLDANAADGEAELRRVMAVNKWDWRTVPVNCPQYWSYAALDTVLTAQLAEKLWPLVQPYRAVYDLEIGTERVISEMEMRGMRVDLEYCRRAKQDWLAEALQIREQARKEFAVDNLTSNAQVIRRLLADGVALTRRTKSGGYALDEEAASEINHPLASMVLRVRQLEKRVSSYLDTFMELADGDLLHPDVNPLGARTSRMSVKRPAMQTLNRGPEIRDAIIAREGNNLVVVDYEQIEFRFFAHFAGDPTLIADIGDGADVHDVTARAAYGSDFTKTQRQTAKNANFALAYGAGIPKFAKTAGIGEDEAYAIFNRFYARYPGVKVFQENVTNVVRQRVAAEGVGYIVTPHGRRLLVEPGKEYKAINALVQCAATSDFLKQKVLQIDSAGLSDYLVLLVHDEVILDVPSEEAVEVGHELREVMTDRTSWRVPITASEAKLLERWGDAYR